MIDDILYTDNFFVFDVPENTAAGYNDSGGIKAFSYDGNNFIMNDVTEVTSIFVN